MNNMLSHLNRWSPFERVAKTAGLRPRRDSRGGCPHVEPFHHRTNLATAGFCAMPSAQFTNWMKRSGMTPM